MPTVRLPLAHTAQQRRADTAYDARMVNCYVDTVINPSAGTKRVHVTKRPGLVLHSTPAGVVAGRGIRYWTQTSKVYSVFGNTVYANTTSLGTLTTSTGMVSFEELGGGTPRIILSDGTKTYTINTSDTLAEITDAQLPTPVVPGVVFLDQYIFLLKSNGEIWNCDLGDPTAWVSTNNIQAENSPDKGVALARQKNQVIAFGEWTTEFFYDAANAANSPLSRTEGAQLQIGCAAKWSIVPYHIEERLVWVSQSRLGGRAVYMLSGFEPQVISDAAIERLLDAEGSNIANATAYGLKIGGNTFYILRLTNTTLVCNIGEKTWSEWQSGSATFNGITATDAAGSFLVQGATDGKIYSLGTTTYQDNGSVNINVKIVTDIFDVGTTERKFCNRLSLIGDKHSATSSVSLRYSDDDYQTWSTARTVDMNATKQELWRLGSFRRRAFELTHAANTPLRLEVLEMDVTGRLPQGG